MNGTKIVICRKGQFKDTANGFNSANVLVKSKIQNENYQINRLKHLKNTE